MTLNVLIVKIVVYLTYEWYHMSKFSAIQLYNIGSNSRKSAKIEEKRLEFTNFKPFLIKNGYHLQNYQHWMVVNVVV